jgi:LL-diaminopimelate aminotransferase
MPFQIARRRRAHQEANPDAKLISLGIGDTTEPIPSFIVEAMKAAADRLGTVEGYSGYGAEQGHGPVREAICERLYKGVGRKPGEIFVSDGSKCDIGRLQMMFGADVSVALQVGMVEVVFSFFWFV